MSLKGKNATSIEQKIKSRINESKVEKITTNKSDVQKPRQTRTKNTTPLSNIQKQFSERIDTSKKDDLYMNQTEQTFINDQKEIIDNEGKLGCVIM